MDTDILTDIKKIIATEFDIPLTSISDSSKIDNDLNLDSVDIVSLVSAIEEKYKIELDEEEMLPIESINQLALLVEESIAAANT
jgi:acyl carrier protein